MAHEIETMAWAGLPPWHGLGKQVSNDLTPAQMLVEADVDWTVDLYPLSVNIDGEVRETNRSALVRSTDKKIMTYTTPEWNPVQNHEAFEFFHEYVMAGDMEMHTAGSLKGGEIVWALAKTKESFTVFKRDKIDSYLLFTNYHRFGTANDVRLTPVRVVCNNTLTLSLRKSSNQMMKVDHRKPFNAEEVKQTLGIAKVKLEQYRDMAKFLGSKRYTPENVMEYFKSLFPAASAKKREAGIASRNATRAFALLEHQPGHQYAEGTWWQALNAVTFMTDHLVGHGVDTRLANAWYGSNKDLKLEALDKAIEYAEAA